MNTTYTTFTNCFGEAIGPVLILLRSAGFFEAPVFLPTMTVASVILFFGLIRQAANQPFASTCHPFIPKPVWWVACYALCFLATNSVAVALKTHIVEELDYPKSVWFVSLVGPLHFYIFSIACAHLMVIFSTPSAHLTRMLCVYVQIGLVGGYTVACYRLLNEPISLLDPTGGISGLLMIAWFGVYNADLIARFHRATDASWTKTLMRLGHSG